jgi:hypothetical protein
LIIESNRRSIMIDFRGTCASDVRELFREAQVPRLWSEAAARLVGIVARILLSDC